jgi:hypothetical protein
VTVGIGSTPGGELRGAAYWDKQEKRFHIAGGLAGKLLGALGISFDLSIGKRYGDDASAAQGGGQSGPKPKPKEPGGGSGGTPSPGPNAIALGCFSVFIGG